MFLCQALIDYILLRFEKEATSTLPDMTEELREILSFRLHCPLKQGAS